MPLPSPQRTTGACLSPVGRDRAHRLQAAFGAPKAESRQLRSGLAAAALACAALAALGCQYPESEPSRPLPPAIAQRLSRLPTTETAPGHPDAAAAYERLQRLGDPGLVAAEGFDPAQAYRRALARRREMSVHIAATGRVVPRATLAGLAARRGSHDTAAASNLDGWRELGPGNIGGRTRTLVLDPRRPQILYTGGVSGGVWKSTDGGARWLPVADELRNLAVNSLVLQPGSSRVLYAGTGEGFFREEQRGTALPLRGRGIYRSFDAGASWELLESTDNESFHWVNDLVVSPHSPRRIYAATRSGLWRSIDRGASWRRVLDPRVKGGCLDLALQPGQSGDSLLASCGSFEQATVYRHPGAESDGAWEAVLSDPGMGRTSLAFAPSDPSVVYALAASNRTGQGGTPTQGLHAIFRSLDGGVTWHTRVDRFDNEAIHRLLLTNAVIAQLRECGFSENNGHTTMGWYVNVLAVDPLDPDLVWAAGVDLFRSADGGATWGPASYWWADRASPSWLHADQHALTFHPGYDGGANRTLYIANDGGVARTSDARAPITNGSAALCDPAMSQVVFEPLNHRLGITQFYHGLPYPNGRALFGGTQDNGTVAFTLGDGIDGWSRISGGDGAYVAIDPGSPNVLYVQSQFGNVQKSTDGGQEFEPAQIGLDDSGFLFITPLLMDPNRPSRLWIGGHRIWRSDDGAGRWSAASTSLGDDQVSALAVARGDSDRVLAGTRDGFILRHDVATGTSGATQWASSRPRAGFVTSLAFDPRDPDVAYATYARFGGSHVWRSVDGGRTWSPLDGEGAGRLPDIPAHSLVVDPDYPQRLFLGTDLGVFASVDGGLSWAAENAGFANAVTEWLEIAGDGEGRPSLWAFTHGRGAWRSRLAPPAKPPEPFVCEPSSTIHCLNGGRFEAHVTWTARGDAGSASAVPLTDDTGAFWFFDGDNLELLVKVLDGEEINGHFWVFYGALSDVEYTLEVADSETGQRRTYRNPAGRLASFGDTTAFEGGAAGLRVDSEQEATASDLYAGLPRELDAGRPVPRGIALPAPSRPAAGGACAPSATELCLGERFVVEVEWRRAQGEEPTPAQAVPLTDDTGAFWFFGPDNLELLTKVLDARALNGRFWVFFGALSNVEYTVRVTDTETGEARTYFNPQGQLASVADTDAF